MTPETVTAPTTAPEPRPIDWTDAGEIERVREAIAGRKVHRDGAGPVELVQTHISSVFLTPEHVFKFKRPVALGFVDFSTLSRRLHYCREEVRLNRRLAPDVYLDIVPLLREGRGYRLGGEGAPADYAVVMRRLPREAMMDQRLAAGAVGAAELERLADLLARFHTGRETASRHVHFGDLDTLHGNWQENFDQVQPFLDETLPAAEERFLRRRVFGFLASHAGLFRQRMDGGFIRDGHGDLRCEHIYLGEPLRIIDCVEFNDRFRYGDTANDLAFLLMDLTAQGHPRLARELLDRYTGRTGDREAERLMAFYCCYRAAVRGKVASLRLHDRHLAGEARRKVVARARAFFDLAADFARQMPPPALVVMAGLIGTGKSSVAGALAERTGAVVLSSDRIRKALAAEAGALPGPEARSQAGYREGIYSPGWHLKTYETMYRQAEEALAEGRSVILDATFSKKRDRRRAFETARHHGAEPFVVECTLPEATLRRRLAERERRDDAVSDGRAAILPEIRARYEPVREVEPERHRTVQTDRPPAELAEALLADPAFHLPAPLFGLHRDERDDGGA